MRDPWQQVILSLCLGKIICGDLSFEEQLVRMVVRERRTTVRWGQTLLSCLRGPALGDSRV
jgi:hypothetical protein